jgi:3-isopropylmalate dehydrogenase
MDTYRIGVLKGDGIGLEIVPATVDVIQAAADKVGGGLIEWRPLPIGWEAIEKHGLPMPDETLAGLRECEGWILGPDAGNSYPKEIPAENHPGAGLRHAFELYANVRPSRNLPGIEGIAKDTDLVIMRENLEGLYPYGNMYAGNGEFMPTEDVAMTVGLFTRRSVERISRMAFELARKRRKKVTIVHKANVLIMSSGLFRRVAYEIAKDYPDVEVDDFMVDAMAAQLVRRPRIFDVVVTENMFGDILSDLAGELTGALGLSPSINAGDKVAMAQAAHGSAPDIAGKGIANPIGMIRSATMLMDWLGTKHADPRLGRVAQLVDEALLATLSSGIRTGDVGGTHGTASFTQALLGRLAAA